MKSWEAYRVLNYSAPLAKTEYAKSEYLASQESRITLVLDLETQMDQTACLRDEGIYQSL